MTILFEKSQQSLESAEYLHDDEKYCSSIHCSYYSCIQLMRHILFNEIEPPYDERTFDDLPQVMNAKGSHNFLIMELKNLIQNKNTSRTTDIRKFSQDLHDLKKLRKDADYHQIRILPENSRHAKLLASNNIALLKRLFI